MDWLADDRTDCYSVQTTMLMREYLDLVKSAHSNRGNLPGQRETLKTTTGKRIRDRMVSDIRGGTVLPPVVIGAVVDEATFMTYPNRNAKTPGDIIPVPARSELAIIDGMQRTAAMAEAAQADSGVLSRCIRVEFWLTKSVRTMVYRMLVLNTGQVPWTLARQLSVVFAPMLKEMKASVPEISRIFSPDQPGRRVAPGEFSSDSLVELYLSFSLRKTNVDAKETLSDEFSRLDFVENVADSQFQRQFYSTINLLAAMDKGFSEYDPGASGKYSKGRNIFDGQPSRIGFVVAVAQHVLGRPGLDRDHAQRISRMEEVESQAGALVTRLEHMGAAELGDFLKLDVLAETLDRRVGQVGRYERSVFFEAFGVLISESFSLPSMEPCWRAN